MQFIVENWYLIIAAIAVVAFGCYTVYVFAKKPTEAQLRSIRAWMLYAVTEAEKDLGSGTGRLKLRYVYDMFITKFPGLGKVVSFDMVSLMVDEALDEMRQMLETNKAVQEYVNGPTEETGKE